MAVLFVGGTRSGKSALAQHWAEAQAPQRLYLATCQVEDAEMAARVARHQEQRGAGWHCVEAVHDPLQVLQDCRAGRREPQVGVVLLDCVSLWLANLLAQGLSAAAVQDRVEALASVLAETAAPTLVAPAGPDAPAVPAAQPARPAGSARTAVVASDSLQGSRPLPVGLVSAETGLGIVPATPLGRQFRDVLGLANQTLARACQTVIFVSCGLPLVLKGSLPEGVC